MNNKVYKFIIEVPIYETFITVYCGNILEIKKRLRKKYGSHEIIKAKAEGCAETIIVENQSGRNRNFIILEHTDIHTIYHEVIHAAHFLLEEVGIVVDANSNEPLTYLCEFIAKQITKKIKI